MTLWPFGTCTSPVQLCVIAMLVSTVTGKKQFVRLHLCVSYLRCHQTHHTSVPVNYHISPVHASNRRILFDRTWLLCIEQLVLNERKQMSYYCDCVKLTMNFKTSHLSCQFSLDCHIFPIQKKICSNPSEGSYQQIWKMYFFSCKSR